MIKLKRETIKEAFVQELNKDERALNLAQAALLMSQYLTQPFDAAIYLNVLDEIADWIRPKIDAAQSNIAIVSHLKQYLFEELKFAGSTKFYYHPNNSFLNKVLDVRSGNPISLCMVYLELGWRLGLPTFGVGMPGHFIVGYGMPSNPLYIDVFNKGENLKEEDCLKICRVPLTDRSSFRRDYLKPASKRAILFRMLVNLKHIYLEIENWKAAYDTVDLMLAIHPDMTDELRDRGLIAYRLQRFHESRFDLQQYLLKVPQDTDTNWLEHEVYNMDTNFLRLN